MNKKVIIIIALLAVLAAALAWLGTENRSSGTLTIFAASSFAWVLEKNQPLIEEQTGLDIVVVEAASSTLARQIEQGAPAEVFVTADKAWLDYLSEKGRYDGVPLEVARNRLVFALGEGAAEYCNVQFFAPPNADHLLGACPFEGTVATGDPDYVPLGKYAREAIDHFGWTLNLIPASDARGALALVETGAADAGLLYRTDVLASSYGIAGYEVPEEAHEPILYWAAALKGSNPDATKNFFAFLKSEAFITILKDTGFEVNE